MSMRFAPDRPLALVTGASSGIGLELARQFADNGFDLVLAAEDSGLRTVAEDLGRRGARAESVQVDLATASGVDELWHRVRALGRPLEVAALNAGIGAGGAFVGGTRLEDELKLVDLNVRGTVHLAKHVLDDFATRGHGRVLFTSSIASTTPGPYQAVYNASKSFVQSFALALREELSDSEITVTTLMPGPTDTEFFERADLEDTKLGSGPKDDPAKVAEQAFKGLMNGDERVEAGGLMSKGQGRFSRVLPDSVKAKGHAKLAEPGSAKD